MESKQYLRRVEPVMNRHPDHQHCHQGHDHNDHDHVNDFEDDDQNKLP